MKNMNCFTKKAMQALSMMMVCCGLLAVTFQQASAQNNKRMIRLAKIQVNPAYLKAYNTALLQQMHTAVRLERGVLTYYAVADKKDPASITILEIYADTAAYQKHIATAHFKKYKTIVEHMVKKLDLVDVDLIGSAKQRGL